MLRILRYLITGDLHLHRWEVIEEVNLVVSSMSLPTEENIIVNVKYVVNINHLRSDNIFW